MASRNTVVLSPLDQIMVPTYTRIFLVFEVYDLQAGVNALQAGLNTLADRLPYLRGRVSKQKDNRNVDTITWADDDPTPLWTEIKRQPEMPSIDGLKAANAPHHYFEDCLCPLKVMTPEVDAPVMATSYTTIEGGIILCICVHHSVMDGTGVSELSQLWAAGMTGQTGLTADANEPSHRLSRLRNACDDGPRHNSVSNLSFTDLMARHPEYILKSALQPAPSSLVSPFPASTSRIFSFSVDKIEKMKKILSFCVPREQLTINNILSALVWSSVTRTRMSRRTKGDESSAANLPKTSKLGWAVNGRKTLGPDFTTHKYLGNVNLYGMVEVPLHTLQAASRYCYSDTSSPDGTDLSPEALTETRALGSIIKEIADATGRVNAAHINEVMELVEKAPDIDDIVSGFQTFHTLDLAMTSWANQAFYDFDFGPDVGKPKFVRVPAVEYDGLGIILPRRKEMNERLELVLFLNKEDADSLASDKLWTQWA